MSQSYRSRQESRRPGQHHCGRPRRERRRLVQQLVGIVTAAVLLQVSLPAQSLLHIRTLEGEGVVRPAGTKDGRPIAVQITDETGRPVEGATVTFRLPEEGPGGMFAKGMRTDVVSTGPDGSALVQGIVWNRLPGAFQIRITAVKGQVRAGTVLSEYISSATEGASLHGGSSSKKWLAVLAIAAGAAAGVAVGMSSKSPSTPAITTPTAPPPQIGAPTITLGRP